VVQLLKELEVAVDDDIVDTDVEIVDVEVVEIFVAVGVVPMEYDNFVVVELWKAVHMNILEYCYKNDYRKDIVVVGIVVVAVAEDGDDDDVMKEIVERLNGVEKNDIHYF
jgi:hypothetical protein